MHMVNFFKHVIGIFFISTLVQLAFAQAPPQQLPEKTRILFLLDGSGSMLARWENTYRITAAKRLLADLVDSLRTNTNLELGLRVYGHQYDRRLRRCDDTKLEAPFRKDNHDQIIRVLDNLGPKGTTPIAYALEKAANDFPADDDTRNIIIIITDGIESCDGDPCAVSLALQRKGIFLKPFIIGIGMDQKFEEEFGCMGSFYDATNINEFRRALDKALFQSLGRTTVSIELLDVHGQPRETNVNVSFINHFTGMSAFEFVHYRDEHGRPDTVEVDPVLSYDVVVNTIPPVMRKEVQIEAGKHNVLRIPSPQGTIKLVQPGHTEYEKDVQVLIKKTGEGELLTSFHIPGQEKLLVGTYDVICTTLPNVHFRGVEVRQSQETHLALKQPGVVNFISSSRGIGSIYQLNEAGAQRWIYNLDPKQTRHTVAIQPGNYKVVFRSNKAKGSKYTSAREFTVKEGSSLIIQL